MMGTFIAMVLRRLVDTFLRRSPSTTASAAVVAQAAAESAAWCRGMDGRPLPAARNPGLSVKPSFVSAAEEQQLVACALELKQGYGFTSSEAQDVLAVGGGATAASSSSNGSGSDSDGLQVQAERVTGRPELPTQVHAPWGYGDAFDMAKVPAPLQAIAARIRDDDMLGRPTQLRDITINYRDLAMFKLDPHVDPPEDGDDIYILGLLSDVVLTFTPPTPTAAADNDNDNDEGSTKALEALLAAAGRPPGQPLSVRTNAAAISLRSWTDLDVDVHLPARAVVRFTGPARYPWRHAIRTGVEAGPPHDGVCDWFGDLNTLIKRHPQRISIIFAFA